MIFFILTIETIPMIKGVLHIEHSVASYLLERN
jgi:hypothetical protein